jgi:trans-cinnamate 4-monooxygenase
MDMVVSDLHSNTIAHRDGLVVRRRLQLMLYNILYRMMFDVRFESETDPMFIQANKFNSERSRLAQSFDYNYGDFIPILRPFLRGYLNRCKDLQSRRLAFFNNNYVEQRRYLFGSFKFSFQV